MTPPNPSDGLAFLAGGGEMAERTRAFDWSKTPAGPAAEWPQSLKTVVRVLLDSRYAMWLGWGTDLTFFYNDAYARMTLGPKHPWALGRPAREVWSEIWQDIGPRAESVLRTGQATWDEGLLLFLGRRGFPEETYHTFSYSPVPDDRGAIGGMLCVVTEDTERTIGERRLRTLRELAARTTDAAQSGEEACQTAASILAANPYDVPFALLYLLDASGERARLAGWAGIGRDTPVSPVAVAAPGTDGPWPFGRVMQTGQPVPVSDLAGRFGPLPGGAWPESPEQAVVLPMAKPGETQLAGFVVAAVSPRRPFDDGYAGFLDLVARQIATAVANARAYEAERRRAESLAELDRAKTAFFSNVSHEFRTPLTLMLGPVEDALAEPDTELPPRQRERLQVLHRNALRLHKLVNTLLDFSRIEAGRVQASYEPVDLASFTADLASTFRSACERAGLELTVDCPPLREPIFVDREMWEKVVLNLVSNAFKYTLRGRIEVSLRQAGAAAELAVRDTGCGITPEQMPRLFERFHRVEGARGRTQEGSGIGLALVRELARLHGGDVRAESTPGEGSTFRVTVPFGAAHLPPDRVRAVRTASSTAVGATAFVEEALRWLPDGAGPSAVPARGPVDAPAEPRISAGGDRPRVLLADDNADMRDYIRRLLSAHYDVTAVPDGRAALEAARRRTPDLVLSDVMMPHLDGFGLLRELRADPATRALPVILLSARAGEEARVEGLQAGADDYVTKPFSAKELLARVDSALTISRLRREAVERERQLAAEIESQRKWLWGTLTGIGDAVVATDTDGRVIFLNPVAESLTGWRREEAEGQPLEEVFVITGETTGRPALNPLTRVLQEGRIVGLANHTILTARDGASRPIDDSAAPIRDADGTVRGVVLVFRDVTERRRAEQEIDRLNRDLRRRITEFQTLLDVIPVGVAVAEDPECRRMWSNRAFTRLLRLPPGANLSLSAPAAERPRLRVFDNGRELRANELPMQVSLTTGREVLDVKHEFQLEDGSCVTVLNYAVPLFDEEGRVRGGLCVGVDVTGQERAREALRQSEARWRTMAEALPNLLWTDLPDGQCDWLSSQWGKYTGIPEAELLGLRWLERVIHPDDRERTLARWQAACADQADYDLEYRIRRHDGEYRWFKTRGVPVRDERGKIVYWFGTCTDIEDHKRAEEALREADRRKDEFLATLAHELRNPLAPIRNALQVLRLSAERELREKARDMMERQLAQMVRLVDDLLDVSRITRNKLELRKGRVELAAVLSNAVETSRPQIDEAGHRLTVTLPQEPVYLEADLTRLAQVFWNLLNNAAKYTPPGGRIDVTAEVRGGEVAVAVRDTGVGIPAEAFPRLFEMFSQVDRSLERAQGGLGIGLALVKGLVAMHGGTVEARSDGPNMGCEFVVRLPTATPARAAAGPPAATPDGETFRARRVLVVDDNRDAAASLAMVLSLWGNDTRTAHDGLEALELAEAFRPEVILLDIGLPRLNGYDTCRRMRERPWGKDAFMIATTGWGQEEDRRRAREAAFDHHLVKPVDLVALQELLRELPATYV